MSEGLKFDQEKLRYDLIAPIMDKALATILSHGARKYGDNNWQEGIKFRRIYAAIQRHLAAYRQGEYIDNESGHPHLWHAATELMFLIFFENNYPRYQEFNDFVEEWSKTVNLEDLGAPNE